MYTNRSVEKLLQTHTKFRKPHAQVEDSFRRSQALHQDWHRQVQARPFQDAPHPHVEEQQDQEPSRQIRSRLRRRSLQRVADVALRLSRTRSFSNQAGQRKAPGLALANSIEI